MSAIHTPLMNTILGVLKKDDRVLAAWLEGSLARKEADDYSDIDLWVCVKDRCLDDWIEEREQFAAQLGPVSSVLYPGSQEADDDIDSFHVLFDDQPASLALDVSVVNKKHGAVFTKDSDAEEHAVLFDRGHIITGRAFHAAEVEEYALEVCAELTVRFWHQLPRVQALLARGDVLEATEHYMQRLEDLVTLYRLLYTPEKVDWGFKDVEYDLPEKEIATLYKLMPYPSGKRMEKLLKSLGKTFAKESQVVAKRMKQELPEATIAQVLAEL